VYLHDMRTGDRIAPAPVAPVRGTKLVRFVTVPLHPGLGQLLAVADGPVLRIVDAAGRAVGEVPHRADVTAVAFDPFSGRMATGDADGRVRVWTVGGSAALEVTEQVVAGGHAEAVTALAFSHDGKTLASGGRDRAVTLWDPVTGQERATLTGHPDPIVGLGFGERDESLVSVGRDGHLSRWRADPKRRAGPPFEFPQIGSGPPPRLGAALLAP
jgi:WD40 repeat protein